MSEAMVESGLLMPSGIIPVSTDLGLYQNVTLESHFTGPDQQVSIELNPFTFDAAAFDCIRLVLLLVGQDEVAQEVGILVPGVIKEIVQNFQNARDLTDLVNHFIELLNAVSQGKSLLGPANAVIDDLLHIAGDASELGVLAAALGKAMGKNINLTPLKIVLGILDGAKYLIDLIRSFGAYLFLNGNYPTITLRSVNTPSSPPINPPTKVGPLTIQNLVRDGGGASVFDMISGPDGNVWFSEAGSRKIGRITPDGTVTMFPPLKSGSWPGSFTIGPDGNLWFDEYIPSQIGRITPEGDITEYPLPASGASPSSLVVGPDGNLWFTEVNPIRIGRITPQGAITEFALPPPDNYVGDPSNSPLNDISSLVVGSDGNLWFKELSNDSMQYPDQIGRITLTGEVTAFRLPPEQKTGIDNASVVAGPDGKIWFSEYNRDRLARITPQGSIMEFALPTASSGPGDLFAGPDGDIWFVESGLNSISNSSRIGRITLLGTITEFAPVNGDVVGFTVGPDGNLWFTEFYAGRIGYISTEGTIKEFPLPDVNAQPTVFILGPDGKFWLVEYKDGLIERINPPC